MVYFVRLASGAIKIGFTCSPDTRRWALKSMFGPDVTLLYSVEGGRSVEREMHFRFAHHQIEDEWRIGL